MDGLQIDAWAIAVAAGAWAVYRIVTDWGVPFLAKKNGRSMSPQVEMAVLRETLAPHLAEATRMGRQIGELHKWHDVRDTDNVPVWYVRRSLETVMADLAAAVRELRKAIDQGNGKA